MFYSSLIPQSTLQLHDRQ